MKLLAYDAIAFMLAVQADPNTSIFDSNAMNYTSKLFEQTNLKNKQTKSKEQTNLKNEQTKSKEQTTRNKE